MPTNPSAHAHEVPGLCPRSSGPVPTKPRADAHPRAKGPFVYIDPKGIGPAAQIFVGICPISAKWALPTKKRAYAREKAGLRVRVLGLGSRV